MANFSVEFWANFRHSRTNCPKHMGKCFVLRKIELHQYYKISKRRCAVHSIFEIWTIIRRNRRSKQWTNALVGCHDFLVETKYVPIWTAANIVFIAWSGAFEFLCVERIKLRNCILAQLVFWDHWNTESHRSNQSLIHFKNIESKLFCQAMSLSPHQREQQQNLFLNMRTEQQVVIHSHSSLWRIEQAIGTRGT